MERYDAEQYHHIWYEHWHRYHFARNFVRGAAVCDAACGTGYGSALLAADAAEVIGIDCDRGCIETARQRYARENLSFVQGDVLDLPFADDRFDVLVSFETIEHLAEHQRLMAQFARVLKQDGVLIVSTPDKDQYNPDAPHNHHHVKELHRQEFLDLAGAHFAASRLYGQQLRVTSVIEPLLRPDAQACTEASVYLQQGREMQAAENAAPATYLILFCSQSEAALQACIKPLRHHFFDAGNDLLRHYDACIAQGLSSDQQVHELQGKLKLQHAVLMQLRARLGL